MLNPYQPPATVAAPHSRLSRFARFLRCFPWTTTSRLISGELVIIDGIAFYLDPDDLSVVFAASPSATNTTERMNLIVAESIRVLPLFLAESSSLTRILRGRKLIVRMLGDYSSSTHAVIREEVLEWDIINSIIDGDTE
ncbi:MULTISPECIES: hypothetical protein [Rhodopirellula]|uniref:hypothetical protein n=1 Tax=Rhodopirellula TaxID=265488 RepID=UPI002580091E|nr:hypothetical protein [Rhodopirellula sp. UBA1907]MCR9210141.1 hypothetical protein [bacterium]